jgi:Fic family protein
MSNEKAIALVQSWLADKSGYDRRVWPRLARAIERNRLSSRRRLEPAHGRKQR